MACTHGDMTVELANALGDIARLTAESEALRNALRNMTANFRTALLLVSDHDTRRIGMELVSDANKLIASTADAELAACRDERYAENARLTAENEAMRGALEPFAKVAENAPDARAVDTVRWIQYWVKAANQITIEQFRSARRALAIKEKS